MTEIQFRQQVARQQNIIIYGAGMVGELTYKRLVNCHYQDKVFAFAVSKKVGESSMFGLPISEITEWVAYSREALVIVATFPVLHEEMQANLKKLGFQNILLVDEQLFEDMAKGYISDFKKSHVISDGKIDVLLMASDNNSSSGAFLCLVDLAKELRRSDLKTLIILPQYGSGEQILEEQKLDYWFIESEDWALREDDVLSEKIGKIESNSKAIEELETIIRENKVSIVHNNTTYTYVGAVAAHKCKIPVVWHLREYIYAQGCKFIDAEKALSFISKSDKVVCTSQFIASCMKEIDRSKINIIYDGVDTKAYSIDNRNLFSNDILQIVIVGSVNPLKNQKELLEAAVILKETTEIPFLISIVGNGDKNYIDELERYVVNKKLEKNVCFTGKQSDVKAFYGNADIAVVCSKAEAFGRTTIEAQLAGCLVIGAAVGATQELIKDDDTGCTYTLGDSQELANKIIKMYTNKHYAKEIAYRGQVLALDTYTKEMNAKKIVELYRQVVVDGEKR